MAALHDKNTRTVSDGAARVYKNVAHPQMVMTTCEPCGDASGHALGCSPRVADADHLAHLALATVAVDAQPTVAEDGGYACVLHIPPNG